MPPKSKQNEPVYSSKNIVALSPREHIRRRPGMYIGGIDSRALHYMIYEVIQTIIEEVATVNHIRITLRPNHIVVIEDNSQGFLIGTVENSSTGKVTHQIDYMERRGSFFGIGLSAVNALSEVCTIQVRCDGYLWEHNYKEGLAITPAQRIRELSSDESTGNTIIFTPDYSIFEENDFEFETISNYCQKLAYLLSGYASAFCLKNLAFLFSSLKITVRDTRHGNLVEEIFHYPNGLPDWFNDINTKSTPIHSPIQIEHIADVVVRDRYNYQIGINVVFHFVKEPNVIEKSYVNIGIQTPDGGIHVDTFKSELLAIINGKINSSLAWENIPAGLTYIMHILHPDPQFESHTCVKLLNPEVSEVVKEALQIAIANHQQEFKKLVEYIVSDS